MENTQNQQAILKKAVLENNQAITDFQYIMAKETEGKELDTELVLKAVDYLNRTPDLGFFMVAFDPKQATKEIGTLLITYAHEVFQNKSVWWFQSVCVHTDYRGKGIFKQMFKQVESEVESNKYPLKLYVETENERAQKVYQKMGMHDAGEVYLEDDFFFEDKIQFQQSSNYTFSVLDLNNQQDVEEVLNLAPYLESECGYEKADIEKVKAGLTHIKNHREQGDVIRIHDKNTQKLIGLVGGFYEFSDWRNGLILYLSDIRIQKDYIDQQKTQELYAGLFYWCKKEMPMSPPLTCLRVVINETVPAVPVIKAAGMEQAHYRVYLKE